MTTQERLREVIDEVYETGYAWGQDNKADLTANEVHEKALQAILQLIETEIKAQTPVKIMGKSLEEVVQILSALELERIADMQMTMNKLDEWMQLVRKDHYNATQEALNAAMKQFKQRTTLRGTK